MNGMVAFSGPDAGPFARHHCADGADLLGGNCPVTIHGYVNGHRALGAHVHPRQTGTTSSLTLTAP
eukprot:11228073-Lingulodinium_polyedra.AAC.1